MVEKSIATMRLGGQDYPYIYEGRCKTCRHPSRWEIEASVVNGAGFNAAAMNEGNGTVSGSNVRSHFDRGHVPIVEAAVDNLKMRMFRQTYDEVDATLEDLAETLSEEIGRAAFVVDRTSQLLREGELKPTMHEAIQAAKLIAKAEEMASKSRHLSARAAVRRVMDIAKKNLDPAVADQLLVAMLDDPYLSELIAEDARSLSAKRA